MELEDKDIVETIRNDLQSGFKLLMQKYKEPVYWYVRRLVTFHEDAQDATQETFLRVFRSFNQYRGNSSFKAWIYKIATNEALRQLSNRKKEEASLEDTADTLCHIKADTYINYSSIEMKFQRAIQSLTKKQQITFQLRYYNELDYEEIAKVTDTNSSAAKANYHIAKNKIIQFMNSND